MHKDTDLQIKDLIGILYFYLGDSFIMKILTKYKVDPVEIQLATICILSMLIMYKIFNKNFTPHPAKNSLMIC